MLLAAHLKYVTTIGEIMRALICSIELLIRGGPFDTNRRIIFVPYRKYFGLCYELYDYNKCVEIIVIKII